MREVKTYAVNCNDAWLNTEGDDISGSYVKYADYLELAVQLANAESKCRELAAENVWLKNFIINDCHVAHIEPETFYEEEIIRYVSADGYEPETPATDAFLAEVQASARNDFIGRIEWIIRNECNPDKTEEIINELQNFSEELKSEGAQ
ncbi:hypothetical protein HV032_15170 [Citrobacter freundii]|nr:hypothetical protein HV032_15170 [Citrobacter freundii]